MQPRIQAFPSVAIAALNGGMVSSYAFVRLSCEMKMGPFATGVKGKGAY